MPIATCRLCHKQYRIPDETKECRCKECGGRCDIVSTPESSEYHTEIELNLEGDKCPACSVNLPSPEDLFCPECGHQLKEDSASTKKQEQEPDHDPLAEHQAARRILQGMKSLRWVRTVFGVGALFYGIVFLLMVVAFFAEVPEDDSEISIKTFLAVTGLMTLLMVIGTIKAYSQPFFWSILLASLLTINLIGDIVQHPLINLVNSAMLGIRVAIVGFFWSAVAKAVSVKRLLREYPDIRIARNLIAVGGKIQSIEKLPNASPRFKAAARRRKIKLIVGFVAAAALFVIVLVALLYWVKANRP